VAFFSLFGIESYFDCGRYTKFFTFIFYFNMVILTYHLERRKRNKDGHWAGSSGSDQTKFIFAFTSSKVRALSAANISFVAYFALFRLANNFFRSRFDEKISVVGGLGPEIADLFTLVLIAFPASCVLILLVFRAAKVIRQKSRFLPLGMILVFLDVSAGIYDAFYREEQILSLGMLLIIGGVIITLMSYLPDQLTKDDESPKERNSPKSWITEKAWMTDLPYFIATVLYDITVPGDLLSALLRERDDGYENRREARTKFLKLHEKREFRKWLCPSCINTKTLGVCATTGLFCSVYLLKIDTPWGLDSSTLLTFFFTITMAHSIYFPPRAWFYISKGIFVFLPGAYMIYKLPTREMQALVATAMLCFSYGSVATDQKALDKSRSDILALILGLFYLGSYFVFIFFLFMTLLVTFVNSAAAILLVPEHELFPRVMKATMFCAISTILSRIPGLFEWAVHSFNDDEEWQRRLFGIYKVYSFKKKKGTTATKNPDLIEIEETANQIKEKNGRMLERVYLCLQQLPSFVGIFLVSVALLLGIYHVQALDIIGSQAGSKFQYNEKDNSFNLQGLILHRDRDDNVHNASQYTRDSDIQRDESHSYSACSMRWRNLTSVDYALLASIAYYHPNPSSPKEQYQHELDGMKAALDFSFPKNLYNVELVEDWNSSPRNKQENGTFKKFFKFDFHDRKHTVIAVQGTANIHDVLADLRLGAVSAMIDFAEFILAPLNFVVDRNRVFIQMIMDKLQSYVTIDEGKLDFHAPVVHYVHSLLHGQNEQCAGRKYNTADSPCDGDDCWTISVTGHSLGGGIATVVGSTFGIPSVSFSGFGSYYSKQQYDTLIKHDNKAYQPSSADGFLATTFVPSHDIVPMVDTHRGSIQHTVCSSNGIIACHSINAMTCDLLYRCGDNQNQQRFKSCIGPFPMLFSENELELKLQG